MDLQISVIFNSSITSEYSDILKMKDEPYKLEKAIRKGCNALTAQNERQNENQTIDIL